MDRTTVINIEAGRNTAAAFLDEVFAELPARSPFARHPNVA
jgi:hypothetical protein